MAFTKVTLDVFNTNYEVKNGDVGDADTLNAAVHRLKIEFDQLFEWLSGGTDIIENSVVFVNDTIGSTDAYADKVTRSVTGIHNEIFDAGSW